MPFLYVFWVNVFSYQINFSSGLIIRHVSISVILVFVYLNVHSVYTAHYSWILNRCYLQN